MSSAEGTISSGTLPRDDLAKRNAEECQASNDGACFVEEAAEQGRLGGDDHRLSKRVQAAPIGGSPTQVLALLRAEGDAGVRPAASRFVSDAVSCSAPLYSLHAFHFIAKALADGR